MDSANRFQDAKERADTYRQTRPSESDERQERPRELSEWTDIVGQRIEQAMRDGAFDNLPGHGKPLDLKKDPFIPEDQQMAFKLLQNNDLKPAWISERREMLDAVAQLRQRIHDDARRHHRHFLQAAESTDAARIAQDWSAHQERLLQEIQTLNRRIDLFNLKQPIDRLEILKVRLSHELERIGIPSEFVYSAEVHTANPNEPTHT